jgi:hypothetical protein
MNEFAYNIYSTTSAIHLLGEDNILENILETEEFNII